MRDPLMCECMDGMYCATLRSFTNSFNHFEIVRALCDIKLPQKYAFQKTHDENCEQQIVNSIIQILILELIM